MDITDTLIRAMVGRVEITSPGTDVKLVVTVFALLVIFLKVPPGPQQSDAITLILFVYASYLAYSLTCKYPVLGTLVMLTLLGSTIYWRTLWHRERIRTTIPLPPPLSKKTKTKAAKKIEERERKLLDEAAQEDGDESVTVIGAEGSEADSSVRSESPMMKTARRTRKSKRIGKS